MRFPIAGSISVVVPLFEMRDRCVIYHDCTTTIDNHYMCI